MPKEAPPAAYEETPPSIPEVRQTFCSPQTLRQQSVKRLLGRCTSAASRKAAASTGSRFPSSSRLRGACRVCAT
eukprot:scaffold5138_cov251-Pinguiococcus_pyrenoidosus.AAC.14